MKKIFFSLLAIAATISVSAQTFTLKSNDVGGQATMKQVANGFGCTGENQSPQLSWENAPAGTKSFAITMYDKDAPTGSGLWHWVVVDMPTDIKELRAGAGDVSKKLLPAGAIQLNNDGGQPGYMGPCPPEGAAPHQYLVTVYALKTDKLGIDAKTSPAIAGFYLNSMMLGKASIVFYYSR